MNPLAEIFVPAQPAVGTPEAPTGGSYEWKIDTKKNKEFIGGSRYRQAFSPWFPLLVGDQLHEFRMRMDAKKTDPKQTVDKDGKTVYLYKGCESFGKANGRFTLTLLGKPGEQYPKSLS